MKVQAPFRQIFLGHAMLRTIIMVSLSSLTLSLSGSFALTLPHSNSALLMEATLTNSPDLSGLSFEEKTGKSSINLDTLSVSTENHDLASPNIQNQTQSLDFSYQVTNGSISSDTKSIEGKESLTDFSADTFPPMWISESTGKALRRLMQLYGPGMGIQ